MKKAGERDAGGRAEQEAPAAFGSDIGLPAIDRRYCSRRSTRDSAVIFPQRRTGLTAFIDMNTKLTQKDPRSTKAKAAETLTSPAQRSGQ
jgi:hypothetical protein